MLNKEKIQVSDRESENPWFGHLFVTLGPRGERVCPGQPRVWHPPTDVYETDSHVTVKIEIAGADANDIVVQLQGRELTVQGCRDDPGNKLAYHQMEISYGEFRSSISLPCDVDESKTRAHLDRGFLYIHLPKAHQRRKVPVVVVIER